MKNKNSHSFARVWAPWRMEYVQTPEADKPKGCIFCVKPKEDKDKENLILYSGDHVFVIMNRYPYNNGHLMVVPYRHISDYRDLTKEELHEIADVTRIAVDVLIGQMHPHGFNIGFNLGESAGAGISEHIHQHIVPRWSGDTNFMPVLCHTKVMVDGLTQCWEGLKKAFDTYQRS